MVDTTLSKSGIYCIRNALTGRCYVGSAVELGRRWRLHRRHLRNGNHHSYALQAAWKADGEDFFDFSVLEFVDHPLKLIEREQFWIDKLRALHTIDGYNISPTAGSVLGVSRSPETRARMAACKTGVRRDREWVERHRLMMIGRSLTEETKAKMRSVRSGRPQPSKRALTYADATEIRRIRLADKSPQHTLAKQFGVSRKSVRDILSWNTYTAPEPEVPAVEPLPDTVSINQVALIRAPPVESALRATAGIRGRVRRAAPGQSDLFPTA